MKTVNGVVILSLAFALLCSTRVVEKESIAGKWVRVQPASDEAWVITIGTDSFESPNGRCTIKDVADETFQLVCAASELRPLCEGCTPIDMDMVCRYWFMGNNRLGIQCPEDAGEKFVYAKL